MPSITCGQAKRYTTQTKRCNRRITQNSEDSSILVKSQRAIEMFGVVKMLSKEFVYSLAEANLSESHFKLSDAAFRLMPPTGGFLVYMRMRQ